MSSNSNSKSHSKSDMVSRSRSRSRSPVRFKNIDENTKNNRTRAMIGLAHTPSNILSITEWQPLPWKSSEGIFYPGLSRTRVPIDSISSNREIPNNTNNYLITDNEKASLSFYSAIVYAFYIPFIMGGVDGNIINRLEFVTSLRNDLEQIFINNESKIKSAQDKFNIICDTLNKNIYIIGYNNHSVLIKRDQNIEDLNPKNTVVLLQNGNYTELIGIKRNSEYITLFDKDDPFINHLLND